MNTLNLFFESKQIILERLLFSVFDGTNAIWVAKKEGYKGEYDVTHLLTFTWIAVIIV